MVKPEYADLHKQVLQFRSRSEDARWLRCRETGTNGENMMTAHLRSDVDAATVAVLAGCPDDDVLVVVQQIKGGHDDGVRTGVEANVRAVPLGVDLEPLQPATLTEARDRQGLVAAVLESALVVHRGAPIPSLRDAAPSLYADLSRRAEAASMSVPALEESVRACDEAVRDHAQRTELDIVRYERTPILMREQRSIRFKKGTIVAFEAVVITIAFAAFFGVLDAHDPASVAPGMWLQVIASGLSGVLIALGLGWALSWFFRRFIRNSLLVALGAGATVAASLAFASALGFLRYAASRPAEELGAEAGQLSSAAVFVIVTLTTVVATSVAVGADWRISELNERVRLLLPREEAAAATAVRLARERTESHANFARAVGNARLLEEVESAFEGMVKKVAGALRARDAVVEERVTKALGGFRHLTSLPPAVREGVVTQLFTIRRLDVPTSVHPKRQPPRGGSGDPPAILGALLLALAAGVAGTGCGEAPKPITWVVPCDGTGPVPACNVKLLLEIGFAWAQEAADLPGSAFVVIPSSGTFGTTTPLPPITVPRPARGAGRADRVTFVRATLERIAAMPLPTEEDGCRKNRSDLLSLLVVAQREARNFPGHRLTLIFASDGWLISSDGRFNSERRVPASQSVLEYLRDAALPWDFSAYATVRACGQHGVGSTALAVSARDQLWLDLFAAGGRPLKPIPTTCRGLYPAVPSSYLDPDPDAHAAATPTPAK